MDNFKILSLLDKFKWIFEKMDVNYPIMRKILQVKLTMDGRRESVLTQNNKNTDGNIFFKSLWIYALLGLVLIALLFSDSSYFIQMSTISTLIMFMTMLSLISDFSYILLDVRDRNMILTKPVNEKTLSMAKALHISIYIISISLALIGPSLIASLFIKGVLFFIIYFIEVILINLFSISLTVLLYFFVLRFFDGEKLKDIINYFQIALSIVMTVGYQLFGRVFNLVDLEKSINISWYHYLIPSAWFAAPFELFLNNSNKYIYLSLMSIIIPIISIGIYIKLMKSFEVNLQKLNGATTNRRLKKGFVEKLGNIVCKDKYERTFYKFANNIMKSEREIKLKLYPSIGFSIAFPIIMLFAFIDDFSNISNSKSYLTLYMAIPYLTMSIYILKTSVNYKGSWIYNCAPIKNSYVQHKGTIKAFIIKFLVPIMLLDCIVYVLIYGVKILPDVISIFIAAILFVIYVFKVMNKGFLFSKSIKDIQKISGIVVFLIMLAMGLVSAIHYAFTLLKFGSIIFLFVILTTTIISWKVSFNY